MCWPERPLILLQNKKVLPYILETNKDSNFVTKLLNVKKQLPYLTSYLFWATIVSSKKLKLCS